MFGSAPVLESNDLKRGFSFVHRFMVGARAREVCRGSRFVPVSAESASPSTHGNPWSRGGLVVNLSCCREIEILSDFGTPEEGLETCRSHNDKLSRFASLHETPF